MATFTYGSADYNDIYYITITTTSISATASDSTFTVTKPSMTIKGHSEHSAHPNKARYYATIWTTSPSIANIRLYRTDQDRAAGYMNLPVFPSQTTNTVANYSESATLPSSTSYAINTSYLFKSDNKTDRTATLYMTASGVTPVIDGSHYSQGGVTNEQQRQILATVTVTLNVPPTVELGTPTFPTPYAKIGTYTVPITSATANYGGDISKVTLTVGQDSTVKTYSSSSISSETISVTPAQAGTFTPTVTVTDSRGQTTTESLPQITVNPYLAPSLSFDVYRTDGDGVKDDEGVYGLIKATLNYTSAVATLTAPSVVIKDPDDQTVTPTSIDWYSSYSSQTGVSSAISDWSTVSSGDEVYGLIDASFSTTDSYQITLTETDSQGKASEPLTQTLSTAFYTIDFQAGGKEIAFGAPATDDISDVGGTDYSSVGLFKCNMGTDFVDMTQQEVDDFVDSLNIGVHGILDVFYPVGSYYETSNTSFNPNVSWGGTWVLETAGQVHVSAGTGYTIGATGGATTHKHTTGNFTLQINHMPSHTHNVGYYRWNAQSTGSGNWGSVVGWNCTDRNGGSQHIMSTGGGQAHNHGDTGDGSNMQPYIVVNRWHRTA